MKRLEFEPVYISIIITCEKLQSFSASEDPSAKAKALHQREKNSTATVHQSP